MAPDAVRSSLARLGPALALVLVVAVFALLTDAPARYLSPFNLRIVLSQTVIVALGAIGMTIVIVSGGIDLSVGATIALTGVVAALTIAAGWSPATALGTAVLAGGLVGLANGLLITGLRVVPFIATLGMLGIARGVAKWLAHEQTVNVPPTWLNDLLVTFPRHPWMVLPTGVWITLALAVFTATVLRRTVFGRRVFALASNELAARACGSATDRTTLGTCGPAGLLFGPRGADSRRPRAFLGPGRAGLSVARSAAVHPASVPSVGLRGGRPGGRRVPPPGRVRGGQLSARASAARSAARGAYGAGGGGRPVRRRHRRLRGSYAGVGGRGLGA